MEKGNKVQIIVHCREYESRQKAMENLGHIKYKLPMIDAYVIEVEKNKLENIKSLEGLISIEMDTHITAQMNRVNEIIESQILNISVGTSSKDNLDENSMLVQGVNAVWGNGIVVVVAAGNNGPGPMPISTPEISRRVVTVGSSDDNVTVEVFGTRAKDYSGRGPTPYCIKKPDIVAPGSNIISCNISRFMSKGRDGGTRFSTAETPMMYTIKSGTSMATPVVAGAIALLLSAHPGLTNREVKLKLGDCAVDLGQHWEKQGWGLLNVRKLLE